MARCPTCGRRSHRVHSRYARHIADEPIPSPPTRHSRVRVQVVELQVGKTPSLQPYLFKVIQEQDPTARLTITVEIASEAGLSAEVLEQRIVEGLEQLGMRVSWEPV